MFMTKKKKIRSYLDGKNESKYTAFDYLLRDYLSGAFKERLESLGILKNEIHIDWFDDIKCIGVQGRYQKYYVDLQIYPEEFGVAFDPDEPDIEEMHPLESEDQLFGFLSDRIETLQ